MLIKYYIIFFAITAFLSGKCHAQATVFDLLKSDIRLADSYLSKGNYLTALKLYLHEDNKDASASTKTKIGRCYYYLKQYSESSESYKEAERLKGQLSPKDLFYYAEAELALKNYDKAIVLYKDYLQQQPEDRFVAKKLWQISNIQYLYEDSAHYSVRPLPVNTLEYSEFAAYPTSSGIFFISNRKNLQLIEKLDGSLNMPFYKMYYTQVSVDSNGIKHFSASNIFSKELSSALHAGPAAFYANSSKMVYATTGHDKNPDGKRILQLHFAEKKGNGWKHTSAFPYNSNKYSISDPAINEEGTILYFSSDMKGGLGGKDIYRSDFKAGKWSEPQNIGEPVNTPYDEVAPYIHLSNTLYFSSNGHAGLGGLDIFKSVLSENGYREVENPGHPLNSSYDDFGITLDPLATHGYIASNREKAGFFDDLYSFEMDIQTYPLEIEGVIKYIENNWSDSSNLKILPGVQLHFIDNRKNEVVVSTKADSLGNFNVQIPYYSKYLIRVEGQDVQGIVSFEVPKYRKLKGNYEIVLVKDEYKSTENQDQR